QNIARKQGGAMGATTVTYLEDGTPLNFVFEVNGLGSFAQEFRHAKRLPFQGRETPVLKLERILKSKEFIRRDKDLPHIIQIKGLLKCRKEKSPPPATPSRKPRASKQKLK
ncbi:MAG: hypothetical protein RLZZ265_3331, partial [Verrucomicrobiota bacterium]